VLFVRADFALADARAFGRAPGGEPAWRISGSLEARKGVGAFGASKGCGAGLVRCAAGVIAPSRPEGDPRAALVRIAATLEARVMPGVRLMLSPRAQYAARPLFAFEEFSAGTYTIGRGYDPGTLSGDSGAGVQAEVRLGSLAPRGPDAAAFQPFVFADVARVWNHDQAVAGQRNESLASAGGGVRAVWGQRAFADLTLAAPLSRAGAANRRGDLRALLSLTIRMWPWRRD